MAELLQPAFPTVLTPLHGQKVISNAELRRYTRKNTTQLALSGDREVWSEYNIFQRTPFVDIVEEEDEEDEENEGEEDDDEEDGDTFDASTQHFTHAGTQTIDSYTQQPGPTASQQPQQPRRRITSFYRARRESRRSMLRDYGLKNGIATSVRSSGSGGGGRRSIMADTLFRRHRSRRYNQEQAAAAAMKHRELHRPSARGSDEEEGKGDDSEDEDEDEEEDSEDDPVSELENTREYIELRTFMREHIDKNIRQLILTAQQQHRQLRQSVAVPSQWHHLQQQMLHREQQHHLHLHQGTTAGDDFHPSSSVATHDHQASGPLQPMPPTMAAMNRAKRTTVLNFAPTGDMGR